MHELYELKEKLCRELEEYGKKDLSAGGLEVVDKLAHTVKNLNKIIKNYEESEYSGNMGGSYARGDRGNRGGGQSRRGGSYNSYEGGGGSYARGRGRNARRDSMGRYSSAGDEMLEELRDLMHDAPDEQTRMEFERFISKIEQMQ